MKLGYKLMLLGLVAMLALPLFIRKPDGTPMMTLEDWIPDTKALQRTASAALNKSSGGDGFSEGAALVSEPEAKMYSWRDANGVMHFSENPPPDAATAQNVKVSNVPKNVNRMVAVKPRQSDSNQKPHDPSQRAGFDLAFPTTVPLKEIPKLMDDAKNLQKLADQRNTALQEM